MLQWIIIFNTHKLCIEKKCEVRRVDVAVDWRRDSALVIIKDGGISPNIQLVGR